MAVDRLSYSQHGIWITERAGCAGTVYHMAMALWLDGELDEASLLAACAAVVTRHDVLATTVRTVDGVPRLVPAPVSVPVERVPYRDTLVREEVVRPFGPDEPLSRFVLATVAPDRHLLLFAAHHLVFDGMSRDVLVRELAAAYDAAVGGAGGRLLEPLPVGYLRHAAAEHDRIDAELPAAREFWRARWSTPGDVSLPGLDREPVGAEQGEAVEFTIDRELDREITRCAELFGVTRFELLLSAIQALLQRYGNRDSTLAVEVSTRTPETSEHIGLFVNELPLCAPADTGSLRWLASAVRAELRAAYRFRAVPVAHAVGGLRPRPALAPVTVSYRRQASPPSFAGLAVRVEPMVFCGSARNALHIQLVDGPDHLAVSLQYSPTAIGAEAVARIGAHLRRLLAAGIAEPETPVPALPLLAPDELDRLVRGGNGTVTAAAGQTVPGLFAEQVRERPDAVAVVDGARRLTYAELAAASRGLAARLRACGAGSGRVVAVGLPRSLDALVALLAVGIAGAAYLPVDPAHPAPRRSALLADARPALVLTSSALAGAFDAEVVGAEAPVLLLDDAAPDGAPDDPASQEAAGDPGAHGGSGDALPAGPSPRDLVYVIYTSGSTGTPKGVGVSHGQLAYVLSQVRQVAGFQPGDAWLGLSALSFDISTVELFLPLISGGRVVVAPESGVRDGAALTRLIRDERITHVQATPSGWRIILGGGFGERGPETVVALAGGEALPLPLAREMRGRVSRLVNAYGPTEATVWATLAEIPADPADVTIGRPFGDFRAYLLDERLRPVPEGLAAELYLGGTGVARGYLNRPSLTAARFLPDPFGPPGSRMYRTGDRARRLPDGRIDFLGRIDNQVKIRGHRVELGEIEARLLEHPAVAAAAVLLRADDDADPRLVGYVVPRGAPADTHALREYLGKLLPAVMVPGTWVQLDRLPLNTNGKLDRTALPAPVRERVEPTEAADELIERLAAIWCDVLKIDNIGPDEDLFDLGGHSLTIVAIAGRIQQQLGVDVPIEVFFETPTIKEIADVVRCSVGRNQ